MKIGISLEAEVDPGAYKSAAEIKADLEQQLYGTALQAGQGYGLANYVVQSVEFK